MSLLFESILIKNGRVRNISAHNFRFNHTRKTLFGIDQPINLRSLIDVPKSIKSDRIKCRISYDEKSISIDYHHYELRAIKSIKLMEGGDIGYAFKYEDRNALNQLFAGKGDHDDILICRDGKITDASYSNVAFFDGTDWISPKDPLLKGTQRQKLIDQNKIKLKDIYRKEVYNYQKVRLFNALIAFGELELNTNQIFD